MLALAMVLVAGCASEPYPRLGPPGASQSNPARVGQPVPAVLIAMAIRPGDRIELLGAEAIGSFEGASVRLLMSRAVLDASGDRVIGEEVEELVGAEFTAAPASSEFDAYMNTIGIVGELTAQRPGRFEVTSVRLRYRLNGGEERVGEGIDVVWTVCADEPAPADCGK
jgi:hypothetical protein